MMLRKYLALASLLLLLAPAASAQYTNIDDIQLYTDAGAINSPLNGVVVTVRGIITTVKGTYNGGTHYIQDATGGINFFDTGAPPMAIGDEFEVTGTVGSFGGEINLSPPFTYNFINSVTPPAPVVLTPSQAVDNDGSGTLNSADYEILGTLSQVTGTVTLIPGQTPPWDPTTNNQGVFGLTDASLDTFQVFIDRTTGIDPTGIAVGEIYQVSGPISIFSARLQLKPRFQADLVENPSDPFPTVDTIVPSPWTPDLNQSVLVSANISDNSAITAATLYFAYGGSGAYSQVAMVDDGFGTYSATIPGTMMSSIEYYIEAVDDAAQITRVPGDAPTSSLGVAVGFTNIVDIQSNLTPGTDASALVGQLVNVEALVTIAPGEIQGGTGLSNYVVGEEEGGPWSSIFIFEGSGSNIFLRGDKVRISGTVGEFNGITELLPQSGTSIELVSFGNPTPPPQPLSTTVLDTTEKWESGLVATFRAAVTDTVLAGVDWLLQDAGSDSSVYVDPAGLVTITATLGEEMYVTGFLDTRFGRNELVPLSDDDIVLASSVGVGPNPPKQGAFFDQIAPNPFNPSTRIEFTVPRNGLTELAIYDSRGRRVDTLVSGELEAGTHTREWNGRDAAGNLVSSGVYYARLRFETVSMVVEKLTLVK